MRLGLLGGSFNPIHHAHLMMATRVLEALRLNRVLFVPAAISPFKRARELAPARDRWAMLQLALRGHPHFRACDLELRRGGVSYTIDTLREIQRRVRGRLFLILGADALRLLPKWKEIAQIRKRVILVAVGRPGHRLGGGMPKTRIVRTPTLEISGSEIRERVRRGLPIRYLVPETVERYIGRKGLYRG